ncbi:DUF6980 family protein [Novosphingobium aquimarinum]|uniref:DUF6980 family protein n=1 Tax=Novosphingobium aquimarinum TaxID=2682494 RepID=UPI0038CD4655
MEHCCEIMRANVANNCGQHADRFDCPDCLIHYSVEADSYGLIIHDGGASVITILFCPWCAAKLPNGLD